MSIQYGDGSAKQPNPDERPLGALSASRLSALSGVAASELEGHTIASLAERLRWRIDPELFRFAYVCGQVVTTDTATGKTLPVPYATVDVYDTVCDYWGFFPEPWPWGWLFPVHCEREFLTQVTTDSCGNFCIWVPRFDFEWIIHWRRERVCFEQLLIKPNLGELLARAIGENAADPVGLSTRLGPGGDLAATVGPNAGALLQAARGSAGFGDNLAQVNALMNAPAFTRAPAPPLQLATKDAVTAAALEAIDPGRYIGPFLRCVDLLVPEWQLLLGVPDISLTVTQGALTIYEGAFDIAWGSDPIPPVTVRASSIATGSSLCSGPQVNSDDAGFQYVGLLPVSAPYASGGTFDGASGVATRVNQPVPPATSCTCDTTDLTIAPSCPADAPFCGELYLYGAIAAGASYYRISAQFAPDPGLPSTPSPASFSSIGYLLSTWTVPTPAGDVLITAADPGNGWYAVPTDETDWGGYTDMLMPWGPSSDGVYELTLEFADASMNPLAPAPPTLRLVVDGQPPTTVPFELSWQPTDASVTIDPSAWQPLYPPPSGTCALLHREGQAIAIQLTVGASSPYLYAAWVSPDSCAGGAGLTLSSFSSSQGPTWVYTGAGDNAWNFTGVYYLPANAPAGCYGFTMFAATTAFDSAGGFATDPVENGWCVVDTPVQIEPSVSFAVVD